MITKYNVISKYNNTVKESYVYYFTHAYKSISITLASMRQDQTGPDCWRCVGFYTRLGGTILNAATLNSHVMTIA